MKVVEAIRLVPNFTGNNISVYQFLNDIDDAFASIS